MRDLKPASAIGASHREATVKATAAIEEEASHADTEDAVHLVSTAETVIVTDSDAIAVGAEAQADARRIHLETIESIVSEHPTID